VLEDLRSFFSSALSGAAPGIDEDYFALGYANSLFALELVTFVERHFSITVEVTDLDLDNFRTLSRTAEFVRRKLAAATSAPEQPTGGERA
jgi:acyl carrier protein